MDEHIKSAENMLRIVRSETDAIGVALSFGKDSLVTLDLCSKIFARMEAFYLYRVKDLQIVAGWARQVEKRYGISVMMLPHFDLIRLYKNAVLQPHWNGLERIPAVKMRDIENYFRAKANIEWLALGWRRNDSFNRAIIMKHTGGIDFKAKRVFPLRSWRRAQVYNYLDAEGIERPDGLGRKEQGGLDFHPAALRTLKETSPEDWRKWLIDFPFAAIQLIQISAGSMEQNRIGQ